jgi:uncharacterized protein
MQCFIYKSLKKDELYLYLDKRDDFSSVPEALLKSFGRLAFVMELRLTSQRKLAKEDVGKVMEGILSRGFFVQMPPTLIPPSLATSSRQLH